MWAHDHVVAQRKAVSEPKTGLEAGSYSGQYMNGYFDYTSA